MVRCEICEGWSHIRCLQLGIKEDARVMEGRSVVYYILLVCLSGAVAQRSRGVEGRDECDEG